MTDPITRIEGVSKSFGDLEVLKDRSFTVAPGEKLALIGPSGSGKTTIPRILMTLEEINGGFVCIDDEPLWHRPKDGALLPPNEAQLHKMREKIGMVFQLFNLFPHKTVLENVILAPMLTRGTPKAEAGVDRANVIVVPDPQSGSKMLQDGRIDVCALPVLSISDLLQKANDPKLEMFAPAEGTAVVSLISLSDMTFQAQVVRVQTGSTAVPFLTILLPYFTFSTVISNGIKRLERRLSRGLDVTKG